MKGSGPLAWLLYVAVRLLLAIMQVFPINWNLRTARLFTRIWIRLMPRHRDRAVAHLTAALGNQYPSERLRQIAIQCLESAAMFTIELVCLPRLVNAFTWTRYINLVNFDEAIRLAVTGRGLILVTAHYGSFEVIGHLLATLGFDVVAIMRPVDNDYLNRYIVEARRTHGLSLINKKGATAQAEDVLSRGALLGFIGDQDAGRKGCFVDFFGQPASTYKAIALLAMTTRTPVVVGYVRRRNGTAQYDVGIERILRPEEWEQQADPMQWISQAYSAAIESFVRAAPEQYWWMHRRWKSQPRRVAKVQARRLDEPIPPVQTQVDQVRPAI